MLVQSGRIATLVVLTVVLAQTLCPVHLMAEAPRTTALPEQSNCHPLMPPAPVPNAPPAPNSGQTCCVSSHRPEAILVGRYNPTILMTSSAATSTPCFSLATTPSDFADNSLVVAGSPGPL